MPNLHALTKDTHAGQSWQRHSSYAFAGRQIVTPLVLAEFPVAVLHLPIALLPLGDTFVPHAVLGVHPEQNLFVAPDGRWLGGYIPAAFRSYPFTLAQDPSGQKILCVDHDSGLVHPGQAHEPFFDPEGPLAPAVAQILDFLSQIEGSRIATEAAVAALQALDLLAPWSLTVKGEAGETPLNGLYRIDEAKLNTLPDEAFLTLRKSGALVLAQCQLLSMQHVAALGRLARTQAMLQAQQEAKVTPSPAIPPSLNLDFLNQSDTFRFST